MLSDILDSKLSLLVGIQRYSQCLGARAWSQGVETFYRDPEPEPIKKAAGAVKHYLLGAVAGAGKSPLRTSPRSSEPVIREPMLWSREPDVYRAEAGAGKRNL